MHHIRPSTTYCIPSHKNPSNTKPNQFAQSIQSISLYFYCYRSKSSSIVGTSTTDLKQDLPSLHSCSSAIWQSINWRFQATHKVYAARARSIWCAPVADIILSRHWHLVTFTLTLTLPERGWGLIRVGGQSARPLNHNRSSIDCKTL